MKTRDLTPLRMGLAAGFVFLLGVAGFVSALQFPALEKSLAVESRAEFVLDEDLDVKLFVHQNRPT